MSPGARLERSEEASPSPRRISERHRRSSNTVCQVCRQRKIKCDRQRPHCGFCVRSGLSCHYSSVEKKKAGLRAGYVSQLEQRLASVESDLAKLKDAFHAAAGSNIPDLRPVDDTQHVEAIVVADKETPSLNQDVLSGQLLSQVVPESTERWFSQFHVWFPILHKPTVMTGAGSLQQLESDAGLVLKSITATVLPHLEQYQNRSRQDWCRSLRREVTTTAIEHLSLYGLQALLIMAIGELGSGRMPIYWSSIALCQRMSLQLGLRDLVVNFCTNFGQTSTIPPRMLTVPATPVECEERVRAFWAIVVLDSASTMGTAWNVLVAKPEIASCTPCGDDLWHLPAGEISMYPFGDSTTPSAYSLYVRLVCNELYQIHEVLQQPWDLTLPDALEHRRARCLEIDENLIRWRLQFDELSHASSPMSDLFDADETPLQNPNVIMAYCTLDSALISLYQRYLMVAQDGDYNIWAQGTERCLNLCHQITQVLRRLSDETLQCTNPLLAVCAFTAARYYIAHAKLCSTSLSPKLDLLLYALSTMGQRWPLADRLGKVIRYAVAHWPDQSRSSLPEQFYDLQYVWLDIDESLRAFVEDQEDPSSETGRS